MKRALALVMAAACATPTPTPRPVVATARPAASAKPAPIAPVRAEPTVRERIETFAAARGGLHGEPVAMPYRNFWLRGAPCWLFFVGGGAAHAAWLATPWDDKWGKPSARPPHVEAETQAALLQDGIVFERVVGWPRAVRVVATTPNAEGVTVDVESLAVRDQVAGEKGSFLVHDAIGSGSLPTAEPDWVHAVGAAGEVPDKVAHAALRSKANASEVAFYESPQLGVVRRIQPNATEAARALRAATKHTCTYDGACLDDVGRGAILVRKDGVVRVGIVLLAPPPLPTAKEPAAVPSRADDALVAFRMNETADGPLRAVLSVTIGATHLLVAHDDHVTYLVEREGPFSSVAELAPRRDDKSSLEARFDDVDGDGTADVLLLERWPKHDAHDAFEAQTETMVVLRKRELAVGVRRDVLGREIDVLGSHDLDDAARRAHAPAAVVTPPVARACAVLAASATQSGLRVHAATGARIVSFDEPMQPAHAARVVPAAEATDDDAAQLKNACGDDSEGGFSCRNGLCGNLDYGLGSLYRFVIDHGVLKLESALLYTGS